MLQELLKKLMVMIQGTSSDTTRDLLENLQKSLESFSNILKSSGIMTKKIRARTSDRNGVIP